MPARLFFCLVVLTTCASRAADAQEALVLSGGGSRGLAHIGVLVALDSLHRDPDLVIGVSMGAIIGSLYAAGYEPAEIWRIAAQQDWRDMFKPIPLVSGPERTVRLSSFHWGVDLGRFEFSRGFMPDWRTNRMLVHLLFDASARAHGDFDRLPRRYRPLAANNENGEPIVLAGGDLARAVRASMAESGFFSPVLWDGRVLIDGGIADYMPVAHARQNGAKTVVAVDVLRSEAKAIGRDPITMVRRAITLLVMRARADTTPADYLVVPEIDPQQAGFSYPDDVEPLIRLGVKAALRVLPPMSAAPNPRPPLPAPDSLTRLVIETPDSSLAALARLVFREAAPAPYASARIMSAVDRMYATAFTESVWPRVDSANVLTVHIDPRPNATLDVAPAYDNDRGGRIWAAVQRRVSRLGAPTEFELSGAVTSTERWGTVALRRVLLPAAPLIWNASAYWQQTDAHNVRVADAEITREVTRIGGALGLERRHIFPDHIVTASLHAERVTIAESAAGASVGPLLRFAVPDAARIVGIPWMVELERRFGDIEYGRAALRGSLRSDRNPLKIALVGDVTVADKNAPPDVLPALGDDRAMPGLRWGEERGRARVVGGVDVAYPVLLGGHARLRVRAGAAPLTLRGLDQSDNWIVGTEIGGVWSLPFGVVFVGGGFNTRGSRRFDVVLGPVF